MDESWYCAYECYLRLSKSSILLNDNFHSIVLYCLIIHRCMHRMLISTASTPKRFVIKTKCGKLCVHSTHWYLLRGLWIIKLNNVHVNLWYTYSKCESHEILAALLCSVCMCDGIMKSGFVCECRSLNTNSGDKSITICCDSTAEVSSFLSAVYHFRSKNPQEWSSLSPSSPEQVYRR